MIDSFLKTIKVSRPIASVGAGTADSTGAMIDMLGYDGVALVALLGTATTGSSITLSAKQGATTSSTAATALTATQATVVETSAGGADDNLIATDIFQPTERFIWPVLTIATANCELDGVLACLYRAKVLPVSQSADIVAATSVASPTT